MNAKPLYPNLNIGALASLATIRSQMDAHEDYLDTPDCPYDEATRDQLKGLLAVRTVEVEVIKEVEKIVERKVEVMAEASEGKGKRGPKAKQSGVDVDNVTKEIQEIQAELRQLKLDSKALQTADKIQLIKLRATLVEKMLTMAERATTVKTMSNFQSVVLSILDDLMNDELRQEFMRRLEPFVTAD